MSVRFSHGKVLKTALRSVTRKRHGVRALAAPALTLGAIVKRRSTDYTDAHRLSAHVSPDVRELPMNDRALRGRGSIGRAQSHPSARTICVYLCNLWTNKTAVTKEAKPFAHDFRAFRVARVSEAFCVFRG